MISQIKERKKCDSFKKALLLLDFFWANFPLMLLLFPMKKEFLLGILFRCQKYFS
uniref:Uncharacterized protein n=1 Tax=Arundo donax TaxID=35708 RepID=A0A0A9F4L1_ARUDO